MARIRIPNSSVEGWMGVEQRSGPARSCSAGGHGGLLAIGYTCEPHLRQRRSSSVQANCRQMRLRRGARVTTVVQEIVSRFRSRICLQICLQNLPAYRAVITAYFVRTCESGIRESNSSHSLGKAGHNRYTNPERQPNITSCRAAGKAYFGSAARRVKRPAGNSRSPHPQELRRLERT